MKKLQKRDLWFHKNKKGKTMSKITYGAMFISLLHSIAVVGMDTKKSDKQPMLPLTLLPSHVPVARPRYDNFEYLVSDNAANLNMLVAEEHYYGACTRLIKAEETLRLMQERLREGNFSLDLPEAKILSECDKETQQLIVLIAQKASLCDKLIEKITSNPSDSAFKIDSVLKTNRYVAQHYFIDPQSAKPEHRITLLHYIQYLPLIDCMKCAEVLLAAHANPSAPDSAGNTPLHLANDAKLVRLLVRYGAQPNKQNKLGQTPLLSHIRRGNHDIATYLIQSNVDLNIQDANGDTALHYTVNQPKTINTRFFIETWS